MQAEQRQASVQAALSQVVGDFGRKVSDDPVRLRNLLIDATGVDAMTLNAEINAVVAAAETQLLDSVLSGDVTQQAEATQRLEATLGPEQAGLAGWATQTWTSVVNTTTSRPGTTLGGVTQGATVLPSALADADATALPSASITSDATVLPGPTTRMPQGEHAVDGDTAGPGGTGSDDKRRLLLIGAFVGLLVIVLGVILASRGGDDGEARSSSTTSSSVALAGDPGSGDRDTSTTAPGADAPIVTVADAQQTVQPFPVASGVDGERAITPGDRSTTVDLTFTNTSGAAFEGFWLEAAPAAFGRGLLDVQDPNVIELGDAETPMFAVPLSLADGASSTVSYSTDWVPADLAELEAAGSGFDLALDGWIERNGDPRSPSIAMTSAPSSPVADYALTGVTEPMNQVTIDDVAVDVAGDGSFQAQAELAPGATTFTLAATSPLGVIATAPVTVDFNPPIPDPTAPPVTAAPANTPPVLMCTDEYVVFEGYFEGYRYLAPNDCFVDYDAGDGAVIYSDIGEGAPGQCGADAACWIYRTPTDWDGTPYEVTAEIWAVDSGGLQSESLFLTMCLNCTP